MVGEVAVEVYNMVQIAEIPVSSRGRAESTRIYSQTVAEAGNTLVLPTQDARLSDTCSHIQVVEAFLQEVGSALGEVVVGAAAARLWVLLVVQVEAAVPSRLVDDTSTATYDSHEAEAEGIEEELCVSAAGQYH